MTRVRARGERIRQFILENVQANPRNISKLAEEKFRISRQAAHQHLHRLVQSGALRTKGKTRAQAYELAPTTAWSAVYPISDATQEDIVWRNDVGPVLLDLPENVRDIWNYGFTEMFNNARDHSAGTTINVFVTRTAVTTEMVVMDDGVGIFRKIQQEMGLLDERHAIFELSKGKLTTDPSRHSGEGIFFTSRVFDAFEILSGGVYFSHEFGKDEDWLLERRNPDAGTSVHLKMSNHSVRTLKAVFDRFQNPDDLGFIKTVVPVELAQYGNDKLISRSQAKRVMARVELFKTVLLNFKNVPTIGQAFADEVFRVFKLDHPNVEILATNTNQEVARMIARAMGGTPPPATKSDDLLDGSTKAGSIDDDSKDDSSS